MQPKEYTFRMIIGSCALVLWIICFSAGLLLESIEERAFLAPHAFPNHAAKDVEAGLGIQPQPDSRFFAFVKCALVFTPTNLALLALLAGLLGGCASNILVEDNANKAHADVISRDTLRYLKESPWSAMVRSFIVYLCIIAGLYVVMDDPFRDSSPAQYARLAGAVSVLCLIVGYDPTRIIAWINLAGGPFAQRVTDSMKVETPEGTIKRKLMVETKIGSDSEDVDDLDRNSEFHVKSAETESLENPKNQTTSLAEQSGISKRRVNKAK